MILGLGVPEMLVILVVVLIIFGPKNLPKLGTTLGQTVKNVREGMEEEDEPKAASAASDASTKQPAPAIIANTAEQGASFCPKCGHPVPAGSLFCPSCGASLQQADEPAAAKEPAPSAEPVGASVSGTEQGD